MDINKIMSLLPHRYPMLLVDRITDYTAFKNISGYKNITINEEVFNGHFPSNPIFPGVLTIEALAQVSEFLDLHRQILMLPMENCTFSQVSIMSDLKDL